MPPAKHWSMSPDSEPQALTTFSKGAAPNTLKTGLGLEGEIHSTMACWPTRVVYSSNVARSFLNQNEKITNKLKKIEGQGVSTVAGGLTHWHPI